MTQTSAATSERSSKASARDRLLASASELFYKEGINSVGIDRVIEHAGVAKASLYSNFGSKDELIRAYLQARSESRQARITERLARYTTPRTRLLGVFEIAGELMQESDFKGCTFMRASAEVPEDSPSRAVCNESRAWVRELFARLAREAGVSRPEPLARQLMMLYDGAAASGQMERDATAHKMAKAMAAQLLDAAIG